MRKRIPLEQLRLGMYIQGFEGSWIDHPFWRSRFVLEKHEDLERVLLSGVTGVWIDTSMGLDVAVDAQNPQPQPTPAPTVETPPPADQTLPTPRSMSEEMNRATAICLAAREQVTAMFAEARMGRALDTSSIQQLVNDISDSVLRNGHALISLARLKTADNYTYMHSVAVCALMVSLARQLGLPPEEIRAAGFAGLVHDIGKAAIPQEVLNKPGRLTDDEFALVKTHPQLGLDILRASGVTDTGALDVCLHHHERMDGAGYPGRLAGEAISLMARMGAVCDVYDAITSNRPYKAGWDPAESLSRMAQWSGGHFDPHSKADHGGIGVHPRLFWLSTKASQASRWACRELKSCSRPSSEDLRV